MLELLEVSYNSQNLSNIVFSLKIVVAITAGEVSVSFLRIGPGPKNIERAPRMC